MTDNDKPCLHCVISDAIAGYGKKHCSDDNGFVRDPDVVEAIAQVLADVMSTYDRKAQLGIHLHHTEYVTAKLASNLEDEQPTVLHS